MNGFRYEKDADNIVTITMDMPGQPVNIMNEAFDTYLDESLTRLEADEIKGVIITSGKETFFAGGDLQALLAISAAEQEALAERITFIKQRLRRLETLGKPVVAAINGTALGGGYEICLATHHRIAMQNPQSRIGLPEVSLGLLPGGGGITRLVRKLGLEKALPFLLEGNKLKTNEALKAGLVDDLAVDREDMLGKAREWIKTNPDATQPWDQKGYKLPGGGPAHPRVAQMIMAAPAMLKQKTKGLMPAPEAILAVAVEGAQVDLETALRIETSYFVELVITPVAKNLITFFFQLNELNSGGSRPYGFPSSRANKLGILGAGMMGAGIAYAAAKAGIDVILKDVCLETAEKGKAYSRGLLDKQLAKGRVDESAMTALLDRIQPTTEAGDLVGCDLIIEAVFEDMELKTRIIGEAEPFLAEGGVFASNTSTLPISGLAESVKNQGNFVGLHFFSPVDKMPLVEIICGKKTNDQTLARAFDFVRQINKTPIVVNDSLSFYTSRVFTTFIDEGIALLEEGVDPIIIDNLPKLAGMPVGPLTVQDEVSQQLIVKIKKSNRKLLSEQGITLEENATDRVLRVVTEQQGRQGKAYNGGFYDYPKDGRKKIWPQLYKLYHRPEVQIPEQDIRDRIIFRQVIEAVKCLEEGVLRTVRDCNIGSIFGIGFPPHTGGQLQYINTYGLNRFVERSRELAAKYGERFEPPELLLEKAEKGETFT